MDRDFQQKSKSNPEDPWPSETGENYLKWTFKAFGNGPKAMWQRSKLIKKIKENVVRKWEYAVREPRS